MTKLDWRSVDLGPRALREPTPDDGRIILWLSGKLENGFQYWERIANVQGAEIAEDQGVCFVQATSMPARQKQRGVLGKLLGWLKKPAEGAGWLVPSGGYAEQAGERQTGLLLAWGQEDVTLDEARLEARWPGGQVRRAGGNLFVVFPADPGKVAAAAAAALVEHLRDEAEKGLAAARQAGDRGAEAGALTDLGVALTRAGDPHRALVLLEEAVTLGRQLGDRPREHDALANLGLALVAVGQGPRAVEILGQVSAYTRETGARYDEKMALTDLASVLASMREFGEAVTTAGHALALARELGDRAHEADLLWFQAIQRAEQGRPDLVVPLAQSAIDIHATLRSPHVGWLTSHLKKYRPPVSRSVPASTSLGIAPGGYYTGPTAAIAPAELEPAYSDPGILRAAISAVKSMESSAGTGMKTVSTETHAERLKTCAACPHHTGLRCQLCGSFTDAKAWVPYERCPVGKWAK